MPPRSNPPLLTAMEKRLLLDEHSTYQEHQEECPKPQSRLQASRTLWCRIFVLLTTLLLGLSTGFALSRYISDEARGLQNSTYSPAQSVLKYSQQSMHPHGPATYWGPPTMEQTQAWERLLEPVMIQASHDEMARAGEAPESSVQLSAGGYLASLGVYHDLHCLRRIRFFLYQEHFYPNMTVGQREDEGKHVEHCLEALRVATVCTGNTGLWTFEWKANSTKAHVKTAAQRSCVDWDALDSWARERAMGFNPSLKPRPHGM